MTAPSWMHPVHWKRPMPAAMRKKSALPCKPWTPLYAVKPWPWQPSKHKPLKLSQLLLLQQMLHCRKHSSSMPQPVRHRRICKIFRRLKPQMNPLKRCQRLRPPPPPLRNLSAQWWLCGVMTDLARRKPNKPLRAEAASWATAAKGHETAVRRIRALDRVIVFPTAVIASSVLIAAPVWGIPPSVRSVMRWNKQR